MSLHSNYTVTVISHDHYREYLLKYDQIMSDKFSPYGIHFCGNNTHRMRNEFAKLNNVCFYDVGWDSDIRLCRETLSNKFFYLPLDPASMLLESLGNIEKEIGGLMNKAINLKKIGLCCIDID